MAGLYVHIPFCASRCIYCDFYSTLRESESERYVRALCSESRLRKNYFDGESVTTLYFGGGTPSRLSISQIAAITDSLSDTLGLEGLVEFTIECNPDDITSEYVTGLKACGVNRISMGVQTFDDALLEFLGRRHDAFEAISAVEICHKAGIDNISIDLMYGLPGQTLLMQKYDLEAAVSLDVQHISSYCLSYEKGTPIEKLRRQGRVAVADDDTCAQMYTQMYCHLEDAGFEHYEISNFAIPRYRSHHNSSYWSGTKYLGLGAGAHFYNGRSRQWNIQNLDLYMDGVEKGKTSYKIEHLTERDRYNEMLMLRLRTSEGIDLSALPAAERDRIISDSHRLVDSRGLVLENGRLKIPQEKMFVSNNIISALFI